MKKILALLCAAAFALSLSVVASAEDKNIALSATATTDSVSTEYSEHVTARLNDGDYHTRWQSNAKMTEASPCWAALEWKNAATVDSLKIYWENARPDVAGYKIQISEDGKNWTDVAAEITRADEQVKFSKGTYDKDGKEEFDEMYLDTVTLAESATTKWIRVYCFEGQVWNDQGEIKDKASIFELEVYGSVAASDDKTDDKTDDKPADTDKPADKPADTNKPADKPADTNKPANTGVADALVWVALFGAAAAVVVTAKKVKA